jgi:hypothetical protein
MDIIACAVQINIKYQNIIVLKYEFATIIFFSRQIHVLYAPENTESLHNLFHEINCNF